MALYKELAPEPISASDINDRLSRSAERTITIGGDSDVETRYLAFRTTSASSITFADYHNKFIVTTGQFAQDSRIKGYSTNIDVGSGFGSISEDVITSGSGNFEWVFSHSGSFKDATITSLYSMNATGVKVFYFKPRHSGSSVFSGEDNVDNWTSIRLRENDTHQGTAFENSYASWNTTARRWTWTDSSNLETAMGDAGDRRYVEFN